MDPDKKGRKIYEIKCGKTDFNDKEIRLIEENGYSYLCKMNGVIKPLSEEDEHFLQFCEDYENEDPKNEHEKVWGKYLKLMKEQHGDNVEAYLGEDIDFDEVKETKEGYLKQKCPGHPAACPEGFVLQHRLVMETHLGQKLPQGRFSIVHHIDHNKTNNDISNLLLLLDNQSHDEIHSLEESDPLEFQKQVKAYQHRQEEIRLGKIDLDDIDKNLPKTV